MPTTLGWGEVALRLGLAALAGIVIGFNRGRHGRAAGLRTMMFVCLAAAVSMVLANFIAIAAANNSGPPLRMDPLRLPLGILTGIGFLGAGAIVRRGNLTRGVTTAATIWFVTVIGLCFGGGQILLGLVSSGFAIVGLWLLPIPEHYIDQDRNGVVTVITRVDGLNEDQLCQRLAALHLQVLTLAVTHDVTERLKTIRCDVQYHATQTFTLPPKLISDLSHHPGVVRVRWK